MPLHSWLEPADTKGTRKIDVAFRTPPPEKGAVETVPKEALYPTVAVLPLALIIILLTAKGLLAFILMAFFVAAGFGVYKFLKKHFEETHSPIQHEFFQPIQTAFSKEGINLSHHQVAYVWNYGSVRISRSQVVSLENYWAEGAVFMVDVA